MQSFAYISIWNGQKPHDTSPQALEKAHPLLLMAWSLIEKIRCPSHAQAEDAAELGEHRKLVAPTGGGSLAWAWFSMCTYYNKGSRASCSFEKSIPSITITGAEALLSQQLHL